MIVKIMIKELIKISINT